LTVIRGSIATREKTIELDVPMLIEKQLELQRYATTRIRFGDSDFTNTTALAKAVGDSN
jgi:hypothetical protein